PTAARVRQSMSSASYNQVTSVCQHPLRIGSRTRQKHSPPVSDPKQLLSAGEEDTVWDRLDGMAKQRFSLTLREWMSAAAALPLSGAVRRPNIVFILVDDLRWDELRCTGHPFAISPSADRLAREGVNFQNAFATTPLCSPSRASFLTGKYPHRHGI